MAELVAGLLASSFVHVAKDKLRSALAGPASLMWSFGKDLEDMKDVLETISAVLEDAESRSIKEKLVRLWLKRLKGVAMDISDMLEYYKDTKIPVVLSCLPVAYNKIAVANRMKSLREELRKIRNEIESFNFIKGKSNTKEEPYDERETTSYLPEEPVIGRDREKQEIIKLLSANTNNDEIVIVPIYGLGGLGKSTLAQLVYNDAQFKQYDHRIWVYVSQDFNLNKIGISIISQLQPQGGQQNMCIQQVIHQSLENLLHGKKVLVVLDDLWEEKKTELDKLRRMLHVKSSKVDVIVTTRKEEIAWKISTSEPYKLLPLEDDICWEIIKRSSRLDLKPNQEQLEKIGLDIAKKCGGVALATQAIGFILRSIDDLSGWRKIKNSDIWNDSYEGNNVLPSLTLSYERMSPQLRICFSYCAIFPKGHNIIKDDLVEQWVALDFTDRTKAIEYIKKLLGMSFLQASKLHLTSKEYVVRYNMHGLVHDLARLTISDELVIFDVAPPRNASAHKYCRYSLLRKYDRTMKLENLPSKIRALRFSDIGEPLDISNGAFSFAKYLRTLDFSECSGILLPAYIGQLKQLRCLIAPRMQNEILPECITELAKLQYLNIHGSSQISALPESIGKLGCLKYLTMSGCSNISKLPKSFSDLKCMVILDMSGCAGIMELPDSLGNLTNLHVLQLSGCSRVKAIPESLYGLTQLQYLNLSFCHNLDQLPKTIGKLECLKYLSLSGCSGISKLPESFGDLKCMVRLDMSGCAGIMELPHSLGNLINLQYLQLSKCFNLKAIPESLCGLTQLQYLNLSSCIFLDRIPEAIGNLNDLKYLNMSSCEKIRELPESLMKFQNLLHLDLSRCRGFRKGSLRGLCGLTTLQYLDMSQLSSIDLQDLSDVLENLTKLKYLRLSFIDSLPESIGNLTNLEHLDLSCNNWSTCLPESIGNLKRLHTLDLSYCCGLKSLPESIGALGLNYLWLNSCEDELIDHASALEHYSQTLPFFRVRADDVIGCSNLHLLEGLDASDLRICSLENVRSLEEANKVKLLDKQILSELTLSWTVDAIRLLEDKDLLGQLIPPRGLRRMHLEGYNSTSFPGWLMGISHHLTNLVSISLKNMPMCTNLPPLGQLPSLENLSLCNLSSIKKIDRDFCGGRRAFRRLSYFFIEHMKGLEEWNTTHSLENGVEEFMFPMLDELVIQGCPRLRLNPCLPTFRECIINCSDQVIYSLEEVDKTSHHCCSSSGAIKLDLEITAHGVGNSCQSISIFHHFPQLRELRISGYELTSVPESVRCLASLEVLELEWCESISALPEWLGNLSSLKSLVISGCVRIKSLPPCIQQLSKLQKLHIRNNKELKQWCELEENKTELAHINIYEEQEEDEYDDEDED